MRTRILTMLCGLFVVGSFGKAQATTGPLFQSGAETFVVVDSKNKQPQFRVLKDSLTKQSLAVAINSTLKLSDSKASVQPYVDLKIEKLILRPQKDKPEKIGIFIQASGREFELDPVLQKADLNSGRTLLIKIPAKNNDVGVFNVVSKGNLNIKFESKENVLVIEQALLHLNIEMPLSDDETEKIEFSGKGIRQ